MMMSTMYLTFIISGWSQQLWNPECIPFQEEEWPHDIVYQDLINIPNTAPTPIRDTVPRDLPPREFISSASAPRETASS